MIFSRCQVAKIWLTVPYIFCPINETLKTSIDPQATRLAGTLMSSRAPRVFASKRSCAFLKIRRNPRFQGCRPMKPGVHRYPVRNLSEYRCATALHIPSKLSTLCNGRSPAEPHGPPGLQVCLHYIRICTKKRLKARRREGDKCFF